jgi:hypothetical protein
MQNNYSYTYGSARQTAPQDASQTTGQPGDHRSLGDYEPTMYMGAVAPAPGELVAVDYPLLSPC